eukprot:8185909-Pyramimonas_sp.AAC.1
MPQLYSPSPEECLRYMATKTIPPRTTPPTCNAMALPGHNMISFPKTGANPICAGTKMPSPPASPPVPLGAPGTSLAEYPTLRSCASWESLCSEFKCVS